MENILYVVALVLLMTAGLVVVLWLTSKLLGDQEAQDYEIPTGYEDAEAAGTTISAESARRKYRIGQGWYLFLAVSWAYNSFASVREGKELEGLLFLVSFIGISFAIAYWKREFSRLKDVNAGLFIARRTVFNSFAAAALFLAFAGVLAYQGANVIFPLVLGGLCLMYGFAKRDTLKQTLAHNKPMQGDAHTEAK
jgi:hypothetical protein